ncbi:ATP-grasp domain-containing protein [Streptomyces sp. NBC_00094]|uniref:preATP grasp domain-containing protein n=1 Tax=Streptomyces sp. NBC_00094 TaxID=2903620 RepID=UPI002256878E|nr:ATP-grasp domain-containing protein [Streptomyces sp. NBC_00094]MCX5393999.1 ATP-grasp domain-containing protein [Streptomyces sp. NBC_00094]
MTASDYLGRLKGALVGDPQAEFVLLCNFEAERAWGAGVAGLPAPPPATTARPALAMEELGVCLAAQGDRLLLGRPLDASFRAYLRSAGIAAPVDITVEGPGTDETADRVLSDPRTLARLRDAAERGAYLLPMGSTERTRQIAALTGLRYAAAEPSVAARINSKIYARRLVEELGLRAVPGSCCESVDDLAMALAAEPFEPLIVKDAYGVSGRGLMRLDNPARARRLSEMVRRRAQRTGDDRLQVVVEHFLPKSCDLFYQFTVARDGSVVVDTVLETLLDNGVPQGNTAQSAWADKHRAEIEDCAARIGRRLHRDGYHGVVGVDALCGADGTLYPVLEINARLNLPTYQLPVMQARHASGLTYSLSRQYTVRLSDALPFEQLHAALTPALTPAPDGAHAVISCFAPLNAPAEQAKDGRPFAGRLYTGLFAPDPDSLARLERHMRHGLDALTSDSRPNKLGATRA